MFSSSWMLDERLGTPISLKVSNVSGVSSRPSPPKKNWQVQHFQNCGRGLVAKGATVRLPVSLELPWFATDSGCTFLMVHFWKSIWNLKITQLKRKIIFQISILVFKLLLFGGVSRKKNLCRWFWMVAGLKPPFNSRTFFWGHMDVCPQSTPLQPGFLSWKSKLARSWAKRFFATGHWSGSQPTLEWSLTASLQFTPEKWSERKTIRLPIGKVSLGGLCLNFGRVALPCVGNAVLVLEMIYG